MSIKGIARVVVFWSLIGLAFLYPEEAIVTFAALLLTGAVVLISSWVYHD